VNEALKEGIQKDDARSIIINMSNSGEILEDHKDDKETYYKTIY
jgi:hypothetical protein